MGNIQVLEAKHEVNNRGLMFVDNKTRYNAKTWSKPRKLNLNKWQFRNDIEKHKDIIKKIRTTKFSKH